MVPGSATHGTTTAHHVEVLCSALDAEGVSCDAPTVVAVVYRSKFTGSLVAARLRCARHARIARDAAQLCDVDLLPMVA